METKKEVTNNTEFNIAEVKPEFKRQNGENVRIIDMSDDEILSAIDFMDSLTARKEKELVKLSKVKKYLVLEYELRHGSHIIAPCVKGDNHYKLTQADITDY
jgi:hypothetical protein